MITPRRAEWLAFILVMSLAAFLRLYRLDLIDVRFDEASAPQLALSIVRGNWLPIAPFSGSVANHPPVYLYVLALPYAFTRDFMTIAAYRALLDVAAIALCWGICRRFFGARVAFIACLLFATAPWAVQFARRTWLAPMPLFSTLLLFGLLEATQRRNPWGWAIAGWGLALSIGSHLSALYLIPAVLVGLWVGRAALRPAACLIGALPLLVLVGAYLAFDAGQAFRNVNGLLGAASGQAAISLDALRFSLWLSGGTHLSDLTGGAFPTWRDQTPAALAWIDGIQVALVGMGVGILMLQLIRRPAAYPVAVAVVLLAWWVLPIALQIRTSRPLQLHYFTAFYPVSFILMALGLDAAVRLTASRAVHGARARLGLSAAAVLIVALIVGWQTFTTLRFAAFIQRHNTGAGGYGPPLRSALDVTWLARDAIRAGAARDVIVIAPGGDPSLNEPATVMDVLLADVPHRFADANAGLILREEAAQYIITPGARDAFDRLMRYADADAVVQAIPLRAGSDDAYIYVRMRRAQLKALIAHPAQWENGVGMLGYRISTGDALRLEYYLRVFREAAPGADYHWFNHLYHGGQKFAALDGGGIHPSNWRVGDILLHHFTIPLPTDAPARPYTLHMGAYLYPQLQNVRLIDAMGQPTSDHVALEIK
ncbi:MAG: glycosyltransferase family 39 protein [Thermoflexales bacterium]|nr:glycosyltransferase family 39 protein [Thermoflexales bacterium]MDW8350370.1 glycosyltransferase family 39 protein [Anaerolineae bacterium]